MRHGLLVEVAVCGIPQMVVKPLSSVPVQLTSGPTCTMSSFSEEKRALPSALTACYSSES